MADIDAAAVDTFKKNLQERCEGLFYMSESEYPLEPIKLEVADAATITNTDVLTLTGQPQEKPVEVVDLPYFFRNQTTDNSGGDEFMQSLVHRFRELQAFLQGQLQDVKVYRVGKREIQVYILGKLNKSQLAGLKTVSVET